MGFDRPSDMAVIFVLFAFVIITAGFGLSSVMNQQNVDANNSYFTAVKTQVESSDGLKGSSDDLTEAVSGEEGASETPSQEGIIVAGFNSILKLGKVYNTVKTAMISSSSQLGIDPIYWLLGSALLIIVFSVVTYTWLVGGRGT